MDRSSNTLPSWASDIENTGISKQKRISFYFSEPSGVRQDFERILMPMGIGILMHMGVRILMPMGISL